ncbi:hypothetical protein GJAV_G00047850 [Gymnothorax javanicus]|nr:hypothetical protein GJAV_G00047850 [Gymnothorax javanicus]
MSRFQLNGMAFNHRVARGWSLYAVSEEPSREGTGEKKNHYLTLTSIWNITLSWGKGDLSLILKFSGENKPSRIEETNGVQRGDPKHDRTLGGHLPSTQVSIRCSK